MDSRRATKLARLRSEQIRPQRRGVPAALSKTDRPAAYLRAAQIVGGIAAFVVMATGIATVHWKRRLAVVYAQVHFVWQVLLGFWFVSMAGILYGKEPSDSRCLLSEWLTTLGYTLVLVPLVVKIATINHIAQTMLRQQHQHHQLFPNYASNRVIRISPIKMFLVELALIICVLIYLMVWAPVQFMLWS